MHLLLLGVSHRTAPIELRERLDFATTGLDRAAIALTERPHVSEAVVVSTCNRAELYVSCDEPPEAMGELRRFLASYHALDQDLLAPHTYEARDDQAARHLFRVAAGLDSMVVGEPQILGQVKSAYGAAADHHCTGPLLNRLFHTAFSVGKRVRSETGLSEGAVSVSFAAVGLARKIFGALEGHDVLVLGAGDMGRLTATHLKGQGVRQILLTSRTATHALEIANDIGADVIPWDDRLSALESCDIVIGATGALEPVLSHSVVETAVRTRRHRPLFIIDIALPRDVEPTVADLGDVFLYNLDDLQSIVRENLARRGDQVEQAEALVDEAVQLFTAWLRSRGAIPTVVALRQRFEAIRQAELKRLEPRLTGLPPEARARVDDVTRLIVEKLLLTPTEQLKALGDAHLVSEYADVLTRLFSLSDDLTDVIGVDDEE
jgi:glutamyl-tRNA reductase